MRIIIAGAGEVGTHLAKQLSRENMEISLLDESAARLGDMESNYDLLTRVGSPTSLNDLREVGVKDVDLFIAVTPYETVNMTSCLIANNLGAKKTLARIDNYEYLLPENRQFFESIGLNHLIYPEVLAASEIAGSLKTSWMRNHLSLCDGALELCSVKVRMNAEIVHQKFYTGFFDHGRYRVVAIKRGTQTIIPGGADEIMPNDLVYFICTKKNMDFVREQAGKRNYPIRNIMFVGGSRIAQKTSQILPDDISIKIIEKDREKCYQLSEKIQNALIINSDGSDMDVLRDEGIEDVDAFIAVTESSEANIFSCMAAQRFGVGKTIAEVENIDYIAMAERLDIGTVINKKTIAASYIYRMTLEASVLNVKNLTAADAELVEFEALEGSKITKHKIRELGLPRDVNIGGLVRSGVGILVNGDTQVMPGDQVVVFCLASAIRKLENFFK